MDEKELARQLRTNPLLPKLLDELNGELVAAWQSANDPAQREGVWHQVRGIAKVREHIDGRTRDLAGGDAGVKAI
jgi:hypothetical protein